MPKPETGSYRIHWTEQAGELRIIRWLDVDGGAAAARSAALDLLARSVDGALRVQLLRSPAGSDDHVFTGRRGIEDWPAGSRLPPCSPNAWSRMIGSRRRRLTAARAVKDRLRSAVAEGVLDLDGAARVAAALDVAIGVEGHPGSEGSPNPVPVPGGRR